MSLFFFLWREGTPDTFTLLFVCCPLIKISVNEKSAMPFPDKNEPSRITGSCFVGGNYTRHEQRCCTVRPKNKYGLLCKTHPPVSFVMSKFQKQNKKCYLCVACHFVKVPFHFVSQQKTRSSAKVFDGVGCTAHTKQHFWN